MYHNLKHLQDITIMKSLGLLNIAALSSAIAMFPWQEAKADLIVCNESPSKAYVAVSFFDRGMWRSSGWTHVFGGECENVLTGNMRLNAPYVYVADDNWNAWNFDHSNRLNDFCILQSSFNIEFSDRECVGEMFPVPFQRITSEDFDKTLVLH